jgi:hypothetical protein
MILRGHPGDLSSYLGSCQQSLEGLPQEGGKDDFLPEDVKGGSWGEKLPQFSTQSFFPLNLSCICA